MIVLFVILGIIAWFTIGAIVYGFAIRVDREIDPELLTRSLFAGPIMVLILIPSASEFAYRQLRRLASWVAGKDVR